ncbi:MAG TPA: carbon-nitrogen hydrolase family protein [Burkholderiaceae bacterium]|nr:carbon-nitrogen hydrolase family protein [Burkholderiaceae bacterium]
MSATLPVAAIQMVSAASVEPNLRSAHRLIGEAAAAGARVVVLPEFFCLLGRRDTDKVDAREPAGDGPIQRFLADAAREFGVWLIGGTVPIAGAEPRRIRNACLVHRPDGTLAARYDKVHLFALDRGEQRFDEAATISPGRTPVVVDVDGADGTPWRIGLSVCYDLRFPEYYRALGTVDLIVVPSAFTYATGKAHWEVLLRARAIENQCWLLAPAQGGTHENGRRTWGHTMLVDPWGEVVAALPEGEGVVSGTLGAQRLAEVRAQLPALAHRTL